MSQPVPMPVLHAAREVAAQLHRAAHEAPPSRARILRDAARAMWLVLESAGLGPGDLHRTEIRDREASNTRVAVPVAPQPGPQAPACPAPAQGAACPACAARAAVAASPAAPAAGAPGAAQRRYRSRRKASAIDAAVARLRLLLESELTAKGRRPLDQRRADAAAKLEIVRIRRELAPRELTATERAMSAPAARNPGAIAAIRAANWRRYRLARQMARDAAVVQPQALAAD